MIFGNRFLAASRGQGLLYCDVSKMKLNTALESNVLPNLQAAAENACLFTFQFIFFSLGSERLRKCMQCNVGLICKFINSGAVKTLEYII